jgi:hypothetical protein
MITGASFVGAVLAHYPAARVDDDPLAQCPMMDR